MFHPLLTDIFGEAEQNLLPRTPSVPVAGARTQRTNTTAPGIFLVSLGILISACLTPHVPEDSARFSRRRLETEQMEIGAVHGVRKG